VIYTYISLDSSYMVVLVIITSYIAVHLLLDYGKLYNFHKGLLV
jgi:hypothetical protein